MNRRAWNAAYSGLSVALILAILALVNVLASFVHARADLSQGQAYSISAGTRDTLNELTDTLLVRVYFTARLPPPYSLNEQYLRDLLAEYRDAGRGRVTVEFVDPADPVRQAEARAAGITPVEINVTSRDKFEVKQAYMGAVLLYRAKSAPIPLLRGTADLEYELTRRIRALAQKRRKAVGFLTGHGERQGDRDIAAFFDVLGEQLDVVSVSAATAPIPSHLDALWILAPGTAFKPAEIARLREFSASGKPIGLLLNRRAVSFSNFTVAPLKTGLEGWLKDWGLEERPGFVVDRQCEKIQLEADMGPYVATRVQDYPFIPIVDRFDADNAAVKRLPGVSFPFAEPLRPLPGFESAFASLARTGPESWYSEAADVSPTRPPVKPKNAEDGPFTVAAVATGKAGGGKLIVVGTGYLIDPRAAGKSAGFTLLANLIDWSIQDSALLSIRSKGLTYRPLRALTDSERAVVKLFLLLTLPALTGLAGLLAYRLSRARRAATAARYADA